MNNFFYKYRFQIVFVVFLTTGIVLCGCSVLVPPLMVPGAAFLAGAAGMFAQALSRTEPEEVKLDLPNDGDTHIGQDLNNIQEPHRLSIDSHDVNNNYVINNNGPVLYMYQPNEARERGETKDTARQILTV